MNEGTTTSTMTFGGDCCYANSSGPIRVSTTSCGISLAPEKTDPLKKIIFDQNICEEIMIDASQAADDRVEAFKSLSCITDNMKEMFAGYKSLLHRGFADADLENTTEGYADILMLEALLENHDVTPESLLDMATKLKAIRKEYWEKQCDCDECN